MSTDRRDVPGVWGGAESPVPRLTMLDLADHLAEAVAAATGSKGCVIRLNDRARRRVDTVAAVGVTRDCLRMLAEQDDSVSVALRGEPTVIRDIAMLNLAQEVVHEWGVVSQVSVPMTLRGVITGVMQVYTAEPCQFTDPYVKSLMAMGSMAAAALEHARLSERDRVLFDVARAVSSTLELKEVAKVIATNAAKAVGAKGSSVRLIDESGTRLDLLSSHGLSRDYTDKGYLNVERSIAEALEGKPVLVFDVNNDSRVQYPDAVLKEGICSILSVPMMIKGVTKGILRVYTAMPYEFTADDIEFLSALASAGAAAVENARLYDGIRQDFEVLMDEVVYMRRAAGGLKKE